MRITISSRITELASQSVFRSQLERPDEVQERERRSEAVRSAITHLSETDQFIVRRFHFEGASMQQIGDDLGLDTQTVTNRHNRALRQLRKLLMEFVVAEFKVAKQALACVICSSPHRKEIEGILAAHVRGEPYRGIIREIRKRFNVEIVSAMTIVGHRKYHS